VEVDDHRKVDDSVCEGDLLVLAPAMRVKLSQLLVLSRRSTFVLANEPRSG
jgi:hypothetical protein